MSDLLDRLLLERLRLPAFRGEQREVVLHLLSGGDAIVVWPTGSGKSLVYQLPALARPEPTVVLSPLIALMQDQVAALRARGIPATFINSSLDRAERERRAADFARGRHRILYVTPERFRNPDFVAAIAPVRIGLLAVDEAHCISSWGHDFRPEYGRVGLIRERLGRPPTVALTATATPAVVAEIRERLGLPDARLFHAGIARPNLFLAATVVHDEEEKWNRIETLLRRLPGAGIVYGALIRNLERLREHLAARGLPLLVYHGDLSRDERARMHKRFRLDALRDDASAPPRVLATRAFGMGIDRADLRFLLHHEVSGSIEELWQEVGRAGRDGLPSWCELVYCEQDLPIQMQFIQAANPDRRLFREVAARIAEWTSAGESFDLVRLREAVTGRSAADGRVETCLAWLAALGVTEGDATRGTLTMVRPLEADEEPAEIGPRSHQEKLQRDLARLGKVVEYVRTDRCRRAFLHDYFGLPVPTGPCGACDVCCADRDAWLAEHFPPTAQEAATTSPALEVGDRRDPQRGDFVRIDGHWLGRVTRVQGRGRSARIEVELTTTLETRLFPARGHRIEVLGPG